MAQVTVTRENGDTEKITLTDNKETGREYMPFKCSDGVTRYALLGKQNDENASHLWVQKNGGEKKYVIKTPVINEGVPTGVLWSKDSIGTLNKSEVPEKTKVTIPNGVKVIAVTMFLWDSAHALTVYAGVTPGKTYEMAAYNFHYKSVGAKSRWESIVSSTSLTTKYYRREVSNAKDAPDGFLLKNVVMLYSPEINKHPIDIEDY